MMSYYEADFIDKGVRVLNRPDVSDSLKEVERFRALAYSLCENVFLVFIKTVLSIIPLPYTLLGYVFMSKKEEVET